jgi:hypothetical protein
MSPSKRSKELNERLQEALRTGNELRLDPLSPAEAREKCDRVLIGAFRVGEISYEELRAYFGLGELDISNLDQYIGKIPPQK